MIDDNSTPSLQRRTEKCTAETELSDKVSKQNTTQRPTGFDNALEIETVMEVETSATTLKSLVRSVFDG